MSPSKKRKELTASFVVLWKEYDRRGDVTARNQAERDIREAAPTRAYAERILRMLRGSAS